MFLHKSGIRILKIVLLVILLSVPTSSIEAAEEDGLYQEVYKYLKYFHISNPTDEQLNKETIEEIISSIDDPYTHYLTSEQLDYFVSFINGEIADIGLYLEQIENDVVVKGSALNSPAAKSTLMKGDIIVKIDDEDITGKEIEYISYKLMGAEKSSVDITVKRQGELFVVNMVRELILGEPLTSSVLDGQIGYISLKVFGHELASQFSSELKELKAQNIQGLILDLRGNPGGQFIAANEVLANFISTGVFMHSQNSTGRVTEAKIKDGTDWGDLPIVLLVDSGSASASEIVIGALKDYDLAIIIGEQTYGKGIGQNIYQLSDGGALSVTVVEYFTPNLDKVHGIGFVPDITVEMDSATEVDEQLEVAIHFLTKAGVFILLHGEIVEVDTFVAKQNDKAYISIRELSKLIGGNLVYNSSLKEISFQYGDYSINEKIESNAHLIMIDQRAYIEIEYVKNALKNLKLVNR